jgi:F420-non-reducing hydrogenase iron-sulfur subunit
MAEYLPKLVCFSCKFGWGYVNGAGVAAEVKNLVPVICSGKVDTTHIMEAFRKGADGVLILGCPEGECHFQIGNFQARKRIALLRKTLGEFGIEPQRLMIRLDLDPEGKKIPTVINEMGRELQQLGPLSSLV